MSLLCRKELIKIKVKKQLKTRKSKHDELIQV